ncbi:response regulator transcription factor [Peptoniphilus sp. Marseille-Q6390]
MSRLLLLEDDHSLIYGLSFSFKKQGFNADIARTISEALDLWAKNEYELLILDVSLPDGSGFEFCRKVRENSDVPIIFLTASDEETSVIMGLDIGGDDYITKPFKLSILISRINALLRRTEKYNNQNIESNGIKIHLSESVAYKNGHTLDLTSGEYKLLCLFVKNPDIVLSKDRILEKLWDINDNYIDNNSVTVYIRRLRVKIEDNPSHPKMIQTIRGLGYKWNVSC